MAIKWKTLRKQIFTLTTTNEGYSQHLCDLFLIPHFLFGIILKLVFIKATWLHAFIYHTIFEIIENTIGKEYFTKLSITKKKTLYKGDSLVNTLGDTIIFLFGFNVGRNIIVTNNLSLILLVLLLLMCALIIYSLSIYYYGYILDD
jgi:hypothetical protein